MAGAEATHKHFNKCWLISKLPETVNDGGNTDYDSAICEEAEPHSAVSVWTYKKKSTLVGAGAQNATCDNTTVVCAGWKAGLFDIGLLDAYYSSYGRPVDQTYQVREAVRNGGQHPDVLLTMVKEKIPEQNMNDTTDLFPWANRTWKADPSARRRTVFGADGYSRLLSRLDSYLCLTFNTSTMFVNMEPCGTGDRFFWWLEDEKDGEFKTKAGDKEGQKLCLNRAQEFLPEVNVVKCDDAIFPFWFMQRGYVKNFNQPFDYEECMGVEGTNNKVYLYPCEWSWWQEFYWEEGSENRWAYRSPKTVATPRRRRYQKFSDITLVGALR